MYFNYSDNFDIYLSLIGSILFSLALGGIGFSILRLFKIEKLIKINSLVFHSVLTGFTFVSILVQWTLFFENYSAGVYKVLGCVILILGLFLVCFNIKLHSLKSKYFNKNFLNVSLFILILFFLVALIPITSADALHYHLGVPLSILKFEDYFMHKEWFHFGLAGISESFNLLPLALNFEQVPNLIQFFSIISIVGLFNESFTINRKTFLLLFLTTPVLIFLASASKPQLNGIALTSLVFSLILTQKLDLRILKKRHILFVFIMLFSAAAIKLNFYLSSFILAVVFIIENKKYLNIRLLLTVIIVAFTALFVVLFPNYHFKYDNSQSVINLLLPLDPLQPGSEAFYNYLRSYKDSEIVFPFSLFVPSGIGNVSMILGLNLLLLFYVSIKYSYLNKRYLLYILVFVFCSCILGQNTSRFYLEPYLWATLFLNYFITEDLSKNQFISYGLKISTCVSILFLVMGVGILLKGSLSLSNREKVLQNNADGYSLSKWVNGIIPRDKSIILEHSSFCFFNQKVYSSDWIRDTKDENDFYVDYLNKIDYIVIVNANSSSQSNIYKYCGDLVAGPFKFNKATRNPFNSGNILYAWIYKANLSK